MSAESDAPPAKRPRYALWTVVLLMLTMAMHALEPLSKRADAAEVIGVSLVPGIFLGVVLAIASLRKRWESARPKVAFWTSVVLFLLQCSQFATRPARDEKARSAALMQLRTDSDTIRHMALGFQLPHPGPGFIRDSARQAEATEAVKGQILAWVFTHEGLPQAMTLMVADSVRRGERGFLRFVGGLRKSIRERAVHLAEDTVSWQDSRGEYRAAFASGDELGRIRCISFATEPLQIRIVCVTTYSLGSDSLGFVRDGLRPIAR